MWAWNLINCTQKLVKALCGANAKQERNFIYKMPMVYVK